MPSRTRCCGTSVGAVIADDQDRLLMVTRGWHPRGTAPVAGHVADEHASPDAALVAEVAEEVGLAVTGYTLAWSGFADNLCSSPPAKVPGHRWWVYTATATGTVRAAEVETRGAAWYTPAQVKAMAERTIDHVLSGGEAADQPHDSLEAVWVELLHQTGHLAVRDADLEAARSLYATPPPTYWVADHQIPVDLPALAVPCPRCGAGIGDRCTSHGGVRVRRHDVHSDRTAAYRAAA